MADDFGSKSVGGLRGNDESFSSFDLNFWRSNTTLVIISSTVSRLANKTHDCTKYIMDLVPCKLVGMDEHPKAGENADHPDTSQSSTTRSRTGTVRCFVSRTLILQK
jgi:hypothetical protein